MDTVATEVRRSPIEYLQIVWRRRGTVLLSLLIAIGGVLGIDTIRTPTYAATAKISFAKKTPTPTAMGANLIRLQSSSVRAVARQILGVPLPGCAVRQEGTTAIADITCKASSASLAARAANALAGGYNTVMRSEAIQRALSAATLINSRIETTKATVRTLQTAAASVPKNSTLGKLYAKQLTNAYNDLQGLQSQLQGVQVAALSPPNAISVLQAAFPARTPLSPKPKTDLLLGIIAGLAVGVGIAVGRDALDDKLRNRAEFESIARGRPAIGLIPAIREWEDRKTPLLIVAEQPKSPPAEAFR